MNCVVCCMLTIIIILALLYMYLTEMCYLSHGIFLVQN